MESVKVKKLNQEAILPTRNKKTDAGLDLYALEDTFIRTGSTLVVKTGVAISVPEGYVGKLEDRSGMAVKGLRTGAGVIDHGYAGEVGVVLHNLTCQKDPHVITSIDGLKQVEIGYQIFKGDRIAQILFYKIETPEVEEVQELWSSERGSNGYGSSGV